MKKLKRFSARTNGLTGGREKALYDGDRFIALCDTEQIARLIAKVMNDRLGSKKS